MSNYDLSGRPRLMLYELLQNLEEETRKPLVDWLHLISCAAIPHVKIDHKLKLRPDENWRILKSKKVPLYRTKRPVWFAGEGPSNTRVRAGSTLKHFWIDWNFDDSILNKFIEEPYSIKEPSWLQSSLQKERIQIHRDDFRLWCDSAGYPLPRFWFPEENRQQPFIKDEALAPGPDLSPEEIAERGKKLRWPDERTAAEILKKFPATENTALGKLLPAKPGTHIADSSHKKRGQRLREKALKISITI